MISHENSSREGINNIEVMQGTSCFPIYCSNEWKLSENTSPFILGILTDSILI